MLLLKISAIALLAASLLSAPVAWAGTATGTMANSATLTSSCTFSPNYMGAVIAWGNISALLLNNPTEYSSGFAVTCTKGTAYSILLNGGTTTGGTVANRLMTDGNGHTLQYTLTQDGTTTWGTTPVTGVGVGYTSQGYGIIGIIPSGQNALPGTYTDTITVSINY